MNHEERMKMPSSHLEMPDIDLSGLSDREKIFTLKYITNGYNGAAAAKDSDHKPSAASRLLKKPEIKAVIAAQVNARCRILGVDANWVLEKAVTLFGRCMQTTKVIDQYGATGEYEFDATNAIKALALIGKHVDVRAFEPEAVAIVMDEAITARLIAGRKRMALARPVIDIVGEPEEIDVVSDVIEDTEEVTFLKPPS